MDNQSEYFDEYYRQLNFIAPVSRETVNRLFLFSDLLFKWQNRINLIAEETRGTFWIRHIFDSAQLFPLVPQHKTVADLGSGAGFPGLILAILGVNHITLIESDSRKVAFLREAARVTEVNVAICQQRIERVAPKQKFSVVTARALAPLGNLLELTCPLLEEDGICIFPKGRNYAKEVEEARCRWRFELEPVASMTESSSCILLIRKLSEEMHEKNGNGH